MVGRQRGRLLLQQRRRVRACLCQSPWEVFSHLLTRHFSRLGYSTFDVWDCCGAGSWRQSLHFLSVVLSLLAGGGGFVERSEQGRRGGTRPDTSIGELSGPVCIDDDGDPRAFNRGDAPPRNALNNTRSGRHRLPHAGRTRRSQGASLWHRLAGFGCLSLGLMHAEAQGTALSAREIGWRCSIVGSSNRYGSEGPDSAPRDIGCDVVGFIPGANLEGAPEIGACWPYTDSAFENSPPDLCETDAEVWWNGGCYDSEDDDSSDDG